MELEDIPQGLRWAIFGRGHTLHRLAWIAPDEQAQYFERLSPFVEARAVCGRQGEYRRPHEAERAKTGRCDHCWRALPELKVYGSGVPEGD